MSNKIALITGANRGLGLESARQLGTQSITVIVLAPGTAKSGSYIRLGQTLPW